VRRAAAEPVKWEDLGRMTARHRVEGLVHDGLKRAGIVPPAPLAASLAEEAGDIAMRNLGFAAECMRLKALFEEAGADHLFIKGVTLNILAYGTLALKKACDIDLLVGSEHYGQAVKLAEQAGYRCLIPGPDPTQDEILGWARVHKHTLWRRAGVTLELHSSLVENPPLLPGLSLRSPRQAVEVAPGMALPTLAKDELFAYLCAHGATHGWSRLKWLADVAALIGGEEDSEIERLYRRSVALGGGRSAAQALLLSALLFDTRLPPALERELRADRVNRLLVRLALATVTLGAPGQELDEMTLGTARIHLSYLLLERGLAFKWRQAGRSLFGGPGEGGSPARRLLRPFAYVPRWLLRRVRVSREATAKRAA
jgi:hypothetical protein